MRDLDKIKDAYKRSIDYLLSQKQGGSWSYQPGQKSSTEATSWCAIATSRVDKTVAQTTINYLLNNQNQDGGWSTSAEASPSDWSSGPALLTLRLLHSGNFDTILDPAALQKGFAYLFENRTEFYAPVLRLLLFIFNGPNSLNYGRGWPWTPHCWNWVEPTTYSLLALKIPHLPDSQEFQLVIEHAHRYLIEHACLGGGWNYGSNYCLGKHLPAFSVTTAEALLALQDIASHQVVQNGLTYLKNISHKQPSAMSSAWAILARQAYGHDPIDEVDFLLRLQKKDGSFGTNLMVAGLATLALSAILEDNPLQIRK